ncbi:pentapeptide repeat-containing protein [Leucobacter aridicollis]|uniref:pentapeptide repeat-containing protein n=1 Tax=Leucobacter aridicollis TaxID=283878 RepID=UPI0021686727|nr:pentapeptide repeat-containing protein [Leucobacter aridicollis]MCS3427579.1 uncharacterized protein YjbI with pentapeptide repeats [Leucobacter aridicollis]
MKQWRDRWDDERIAMVERQLLAIAGSSNTPPPESPFGFTETGRIDLRGATFTQSVKYAGIAGADFSDVIFRGGASVTEAELENCVLDRVDMRNVFVRRRFINCSFVGAKLTGARLGGVFTDCDFSGATLSGSVASGVRFERCVFTGARLSSVMWTQRCVFDNCVYDGLKSLSGSLAGAEFIGTAPGNLASCVTDHVRLP